MTPLERAIHVCGSQAELARRIGGRTRTGHIYYWLKNGVTPEVALQIERATGCAVMRHELRPDVFGSPPAEQAPSADGHASAIARVA